MSHFTKIKTKLAVKEYIVKALADLGYSCREGVATVKAHDGSTATVDFCVATRNPGFDIGFKKTNGSFDMLADWWGIKEMKQELFTRQLSQRYAYHATKAKLEEQGFSVASEETDKDGQIHLVLRRMT